MKALNDILDYAIFHHASDIHIEENKILYLRLGANIKGLEDDFLVEPIILDSILKVCQVSNAQLEREKFVDESFSYDDIRVRTHLYYANKNRCATLRLLYSANLSIPDDEEGLLLKKISKLKEGLVLITGPTGSGKSYTLGCCLEFINQTMAKHIITLEDPIEYIFSNKQSLIHQKQLGLDVDTMANGVRDALREDPDVIMIGELRDRITLEAALHAAETGHLVFATLHTQRAIMAINRMLSIFPGSQQDEIRSQLSQVLKAIICQRLVYIDDHIVSIKDILVNTPAIANLIRQRKEPQILSIQETQNPMQTMEMAINKLIKKWGPRVELMEVLESSNEGL